MLNKHQLVGQSLDTAIPAIYQDIEYKGTTKYYWLYVPTMTENYDVYIRFPTDMRMVIEYNDEHIITKVY